MSYPQDNLIDEEAAKKAEQEQESVDLKVDRLISDLDNLQVKIFYRIFLLFKNFSIKFVLYFPHF